MDIFRRALTIENTKKYRSMEDASLYVGVEVVRYPMEKSNKEHWMTLAMSCDPCRYGYTTSSFAESYNNSIGYARSSQIGNTLVSIINKEYEKLNKLLVSIDRVDNGQYMTALSSIDHELLRVNITENDSFKCIEKDEIYELLSNGTVTGVMIIRNHSGKMKFFCQCGYPQNHMVPCHHCIKLLVLINREYMNKETVYKLVDDVLKAESYRKFLNESKITLPNMCYVRTKRSMIDTLDNPLTGNEPFIFTSLDEQTYVDSRDIESTHSSIEQMKFIEAVPHEVHIGCLRSY